MKQIRTCGECPGKLQYEESGMYFCPAMIIAKKVEEMILDLSIIHKDCPLRDVDANDRLAGKLREKIESVKRQSYINYETNEIFMLMMFGDWIDELSSATSPAPPTEPVKVKAIEWRYDEMGDCEGYAGNRHIATIRNCQYESKTTPWKVFFAGFLNQPIILRDSLEVAQLAAQTALNDFVKGMIE